MAYKKYLSVLKHPSVIRRWMNYSMA